MGPFVCILVGTVPLLQCWLPRHGVILLHTHMVRDSCSSRQKVSVRTYVCTRKGPRELETEWREQQILWSSSAIT